LKLKHDELVTKFAFKFNLCRHNEGAHQAVLATTSAAFRLDVASKVSNVVPTLGFGALVASSALLAVTASGDRDIRRRVGVAWAAQFSVTAVVGTLKVGRVWQILPATSLLPSRR
jgi:hypothetical protein